jgi:hypothetical protein
MVFWLWVTSLWAAEVMLQSDGEIYAGMPFVLTVLASDFEEDPTPEVSSFSIRDCSVDFLGVSPSVSSQISIINGRRSVSKDVRFAFQYRIVPGKNGVYQIPSVRVSQGSVVAESGPAEFEVRDVERSGDIDIQLQLPKRGVRVGEVVPVFVDLYLRTNINDQSIMVPFFDMTEHVAISAPKEVGDQTIAITTSSGGIELPFSREKVRFKNRDFTRIRLRAEATMIKAGTLNLPPARLVAQIPGRMRRDSFGFPSRSMKKVQALDGARKFVIEPLPLSGQPKSFAGAVGESFSIDVRAQRTVVKVGDPIELEILIRGKGSMNGLKLLDLYLAGLDKKLFV